MDKIEKLFKEFTEQKSTRLKLENLQLEEIPEKVYDLVELKSLDLSRNKIKSVSPKISKLTQLRDLWLNYNQLEELPDEVANLPNLQSIHLSNNRFIKFPSIFIDKELRHLCLRSNFIEELPVEIEQTKIREIQLLRNRIKKIPITFDNADFYLSLSLQGNPLVDPPMELFRVSTSLVKFLYDKERGRIFSIPLQTELRTTFKQYLSYFKDFVKSTKGKKIGFEVRDDETGIEIEIKTENNAEHEVEEIKLYMQEYVSFIKKQVDEIKPNFEVNIDNTSKEFVLLELRNQVRHLQSQVELQAIRNASLIEDRERYYQLLNNLTQRTPQFHISNQSFSQSSLSQTNEFNIELKEDIPKLLEGLTNLRKIIPEDEKFVTNELEKIDDELLVIEEHPTGDNINKAPFKKLKRVLDAINDEESNLNKTIKGSQKAIKAVQEVAKVYNRFAEWLALPQVPKVFLGKD